MQSIGSAGMQRRGSKWCSLTEAVKNSKAGWEQLTTDDRRNQRHSADAQGLSIAHLRKMA